MSGLIECQNEILMIEEQIYKFIINNSAEKLVKILQDKTLSIDQPLHRYGGKTALHIAICKRSTKCVEALLDNGSDAVAVDDCGKTPLEFAFTYCRCECLELLLERNIIPPDKLWDMAVLIQNRRSPSYLLSSMPILGCIIKATPNMSRKHWEELRNDLILFSSEEYERILKIAICCGHRNRDFFLTQCNSFPTKFKDWYSIFKKTPQSLFFLSNSAVRRSIKGTTVFYASRHLPIPNRLKDILIRPDYFMQK